MGAVQRGCSRQSSRIVQAGKTEDYLTESTTGRTPDVQTINDQFAVPATEPTVLHLIMLLEINSSL